MSDEFISHTFGDQAPMQMIIQRAVPGVCRRKKVQCSERSCEAKRGQAYKDEPASPRHDREPSRQHGQRKQYPPN